jgi:hypothetical protein
MDCKQERHLRNRLIDYINKASLTKVIELCDLVGINTKIYKCK